MNIYTSYFANLKKLPKDIIPISICGKAPNWYKGIQYKILAPKWEFFKLWKYKTYGFEQYYQNNDYYIKKFYELVLNKLDYKTVINRLSQLSDGKDVALICYEKPSDFCHRHLVAEWLISNGAECKEWIIDKKEKI